MGDAPARSAVWYAVARRDERLDRWSLRVSMTADAERGAREDASAPDIDVACALLRAWFETVTSGDA